MRTTASISSFRPLLTTLLGALLLSACQSPAPAAKAPAPSSATLSSQISATAQVVAIDGAARLITLRREDGGLLQVKAGEEVRNFAQIAVGDTLLVQYDESLQASLRPVGEPAGPVEAGVVAARAEKGAKPGAGLGLAISVRVKIESLDREREIVVFSLGSGALIARRIATSEGREFVKGLKVGDTVQLDYTQAVALSIKKL